MNDDERNLYEKLYEMFQEDASTVIDLPGNGYLTFVKKKKTNWSNIGIVSPRHEQDQTKYLPTSSA